jgi:hypothetical protein
MKMDSALLISVSMVQVILEHPSILQKDIDPTVYPLSVGQVTPMPGRSSHRNQSHVF